jgi:NOL1/NOP2/sun family putative RNA methylase
LPYIIERYLEFLGYENTVKLLKANEIPLNSWIRVNSLKIKSDALVERLNKKGFNLQKSVWIPNAFKIEKKVSNLGSLHEFLQGYYYIQNIVSMLPSIILNPKAKECVIDMCAAPGGKSTHLAQLMENQGKLLLIERNEKRIPSLETNINRMGAYNSIIMNFDATNLEELNLKADKILLDAPCTGEGLIRKDPRRKKSKSIQDIHKLAHIQKQLLSAGLNSLKESGVLVYSTCSIAPEENELVINEVLKKIRNIKIIPIKKQYGMPGYSEIFGKSLSKELKYSQRFYPHIHDSIGFFICLMKRWS